MNIAVYKNDNFRTPYLIHEVLKDKVSLGIQDYPDIEQDFYTPLEEVEILKEGTAEYKRAKKTIEILL